MFGILEMYEEIEDTKGLIRSVYLKGTDNIMAKRK